MDQYHRPSGSAARGTSSRTAPLRAFLAALLTVGGTLAVALQQAPFTASGSSRADADNRPNVLLILTDDMARTDLRWMPETRRLIQNRGVTSTGFVSNHPMCCPARAEILTGQYAQNNGVHHNKGVFGGYPSLKSPDNNLGSWLRSTGYRTAFVGKHLNGWETTRDHQGGWTVFNPILGNIYGAYDLTMFRNGNPATYRGVHTADLMGELTTRYIKRFSDSGAPFFIWTNQVPPHDMFVNGRFRPPVPAIRHNFLYRDAMPPSLSDPAFNEADVSDKPAWVRQRSPVSKKRVISLHRARIRSLRAVDDQVRAAVRTLRETGELANTYIVFASDNGFQLGEHRTVGKNKPYEESLQVPFLVRGPGIPVGAVRTGMFGMADVAPTIAAMAKVQPGRPVDGRSMLPFLRRGGTPYSHYLIQGGADDADWWWRGVRSQDHVYVRYAATGAEELYDRRSDPHQLVNLAGDPAHREVKQEYADRLARLEHCAGASCRTGGAPES